MLHFIKKNTVIVVLAMMLLYFMGKYLYAKPKFINGEIAPDFVLQTAADSSFQLSSLKGQYVLLDFWGSWCGPCLNEAPDLKRLYETFHGKKFVDASGFDMVSVGIEEDKNRWLSAINRYNLTGPYHVSDFKNLDSPVAKQYGVRVIPTKFLINTEGVIIGVNQPIEVIEKFLHSKISKSY
jgi:thiol-disulfide isomerase/thioredoxin